MGDFIFRTATKFTTLPRSTKSYIAGLADFLILCASYGVAVFVSFESLDRAWAIFSVPVMLASSALAIAIFHLTGIYRNMARMVGIRFSRLALIAVTISALLLFSWYAFNLELKLPQMVFNYWLNALVGIVGIRAAVRVAAASKGGGRSVGAKSSVIIFGAGSSGRQLLASLKQTPETRVVAFLDDDVLLKNINIGGVAVCGPDQLNEIIFKHKVDKILLAIPSAPFKRRREIIRELSSYPVTVLTIPGMAEMASGKVRISDLREVNVYDLLGRTPVTPKPELFATLILQRVVMVTGAGGSIGSELCRQIMSQRPRKIILFEVSEPALYLIDREMRQIAEEENIEVEIVPALGSVQNRNRMKSVLTSHNVQTIYHAAAYKHVPLVEYNVIEGIRNNVLGTWALAREAMAANVENFVLISTDKAVRPTNVMGATKRLAELVLQALSDDGCKTCFTMVRFGNVLDSSGSVVPLFRKQIQAGGPVTVTHPDIIRYFMTMPEAAQLVIQAGALAEGGEVYVLDMGKPVKILDLARSMIRLTGLSIRDEDDGPGDIAIEFTGLRPGEKLYEELLVGKNEQATEHPRIMKAQEKFMPLDELVVLLDKLGSVCNANDALAACDLLVSAPAGFRHDSGCADHTPNLQPGQIEPPESDIRPPLALVATH